MAETDGRRAPDSPRSGSIAAPEPTREAGPRCATTAGAGTLPARRHPNSEPDVPARRRIKWTLFATQSFGSAGFLISSTV
ncbi:MAG: hypothetical protein R2909_24250, partial [Gemmatimonadales bacterium]